MFTNRRISTYSIQPEILGAVSGNFPEFCKCFIFSKSVFATFSNSAGHQNLSAKHYGDGDNNRFYPDVTDNFYPLVHVIKWLEVS